MGPWQICHAEVGIPFPSCQTLRTRSGQICPLLRHVSSRPPEPREPPHWQQPTTKEDYYHRGHRQQDPSQWQDWDDWGKWKTPSSHDQSSWSSRKPDHAHYSPPTLYLGHHSPPFTPSCSPPLCGFPLQAPDRLLQFRSITSLVQKTASQVRQQTNPGDRPLAACRFLLIMTTKPSG